MGYLFYTAAVWMIFFFVSCQHPNHSGSEGGNQTKGKSGPVLKNLCREMLPISLTEDQWTLVYDGHGQGYFNTVNQSVFLSPQSSTREDETHATLFITKQLTDLQNFVVSIDFKNIAPLRKPYPNQWEVFWLLFNYRSIPSNIPYQHLKESNYILFKPNGGEIGKAWGEIDQSYLWSQDSPSANYGESHRLTIMKRGQVISVEFDDQLILENFQSAEPLFDTPGALGLYTEDASVEVTAASYCRL